MIPCYPLSDNNADLVHPAPRADGDRGDRRRAGIARDGDPGRRSRAVRGARSASSRAPPSAPGGSIPSCRGLDPTLVQGGDFRFNPGVVVTTAAAVSGLEFDALVIPDLSPAFYPPSPERGRALYVSATRARLAVAAHSRDLVAAGVGYWWEAPVRVRVSPFSPGISPPASPAERGTRRTTTRRR